MNARVKTKVILLLGSLLLVPAVSYPQNESNSPPVPRFDVVVERESFLPSDEIPFELWIANPSGQDLEDMQLRLGGPDFIRLNPGDCPVKVVADVVRLGSLGPGSTFRCRPKLITANAVGQGEFTIVFSLQYRGPDFGQSYLIRPQKVQVSLFGTQTVAGVNIALLAYLAPGLVVFALLRLLRLPFVEKLSMIEIGVGAVAFSIFMLSLATATGFESTMSPRGFFGLCLASAFLGAMFAAPLILRRIQEERRKRLLIDNEEPPASALEKASMQQKKMGWRLPWRQTGSPKHFGPVQVELNNGERLWGSFSGETVEGIYLFGWYQVDPGQDEKLREELQKQIVLENLSYVLKLTRQAGLELELSRNICHESWESDTPQPTDEPERVLTRSELKRTPALDNKFKELDCFPIRLKPKLMSVEAAPPKKTARGEPRAAFV